MANKGKVAQDSHGTPFKRAPGPGPKDEDEGAMGSEAVERVAGGPEHTAEDELQDEEAREVGRDGHATTKNPPR
jgi:hypothetical protein